MESGGATHVGEPSATRILEIARAVHAHADLEDHELVRRLQDVAGLSEREAELAVVFVPVAFARPILRNLGLNQFPETYFIKDPRGTWLERRLADEPWYRAALHIGVATVTHGYAADGCIGAKLTVPLSEAAGSLRSPAAFFMKRRSLTPAR